MLVYVDEVARLLVTDFDLKAGELKFYRPKVDKTQTHKLTVRTLAVCSLGNCYKQKCLLRNRCICANQNVIGVLSFYTRFMQ